MSTIIANKEPKPCVLCEKPAKDCRCAFKSPRKSKWSRKSELWTTSPRRMADILQELHDNYPISEKSRAEFIFKFVAIEITALPPEAPNCSEVTSVAASRKSNEKSEE